MTWNESNRIFTHDQHSGPTVVFAGDATSGGPPHYAPEIWHAIDLKPLGVSADAKFAEITGFLIITDLGSEIDNLTAVEALQNPTPGPTPTIIAVPPTGLTVQFVQEP